MTVTSTLTHRHHHEERRIEKPFSKFRVQFSSDFLVDEGEHYVGQLHLFARIGRRDYHICSRQALSAGHLFWMSAGQAPYTLIAGTYVTLDPRNKNEDEITAFLKDKNALIDTLREKILSGSGKYPLAHEGTFDPRRKRKVKKKFLEAIEKGSLSAMDQALRIGADPQEITIYKCAKCSAVWFSEKGITFHANYFCNSKEEDYSAYEVSLLTHAIDLKFTNLALTLRARGVEEKRNTLLLKKL